MEDKARASSEKYNMEAVQSRRKEASRRKKASVASGREGASVYGDASTMCWSARGNASPCTGVPEYIRMYAHMVGYPSKWECIPIRWDTHTCGNEFPYTAESDYMGMPPHVLEYTWECIPVYRDAPVHGHAFPYAWVFQYMGTHGHMLRYPNMQGCIPIHQGTSVYGDASPFAGVHMGMHPRVYRIPHIQYAGVPQYIGNPKPTQPNPCQHDLHPTSPHPNARFPGRSATMPQNLPQVLWGHHILEGQAASSKV